MAPDAIACAGSPANEVKGVACDMPVLGYKVNTCNTLRLWKSEAVESFDFQDFNVGDYYGAVQREGDLRDAVQGALSERRAGDRQAPAPRAAVLLRLVLAAGHAPPAELKGETIERLPELFAVQLNDTHPSIAVAELMRLLVDERMLPWDAGLGHHPAHARLHQPHAAARGARNLGVAAIPGSAAAPARNHLRDQSPLPGGSAASVIPATMRAWRACR